MTADIRETGVELYRRWASMWNGELQIAREIIAEGFSVHLTADAVPPSEPIRDAPSVARWVAAIRERGIDLSYAIELGPLVDGDLVTAYWRLTGLRRMPDGAPPQPFVRVGIDILRWRQDRIVECWTMNNNAPLA